VDPGPCHSRSTTAHSRRRLRRQLQLGVELTGCRAS
jgi:hypothetical protein